MTPRQRYLLLYALDDIANREDDMLADAFGESIRAVTSNLHLAMNNYRDDNRRAYDQLIQIPELLVIRDLYDYKLENVPQTLWLSGLNALCNRLIDAGVDVRD